MDRELMILLVGIFTGYMIHLLVAQIVYGQKALLNILESKLNLSHTTEKEG